MDGEAVRVAFPSLLDKRLADWREYHPAILVSYCVDTDIKLWTYKHENLEFAENRTCQAIDGHKNTVTVAFLDTFEEEGIWPPKLAEYCEDNGVECYTYEQSEVEFIKT